MPDTPPDPSPSLQVTLELFATEGFELEVYQGSSSHTTTGGVRWSLVQMQDTVDQGSPHFSDLRATVNSKRSAYIYR